ncbi:hypothetical protein GGI12_005935 [Dipsacomyces acuminosporus]|nr:hypothetical protein GGI12_005935 [Dipsacomyces acuminosporus]
MGNTSQNSSVSSLEAAPSKRGGLNIRYASKGGGSASRCLTSTSQGDGSDIDSNEDDIPLSVIARSKPGSAERHGLSAHRSADDYMSSFAPVSRGQSSTYRL